MPDSEKDAAADEVAERRATFNLALSNKRKYPVQEFRAFVQTGRPVSRVLLMEYRAQMIDQGLSASTINVRLSAIPKLVSEARENNLLDPAKAARILTVPGVPTRGVRLGHWLTPGKLNVFWLSPTAGA
jgi:hypothetical protein